MKNHCKNCQYFVQYYYKDRYGRYLEIPNAGHCKHLELPFKTADKILKRNLPCEKFQPKEVITQDKNKLAIDNLHRAKMMLSDTVRILKT